MDSVEKYITSNGKASIICANTTEMVDEIRKLQDLTPTTTAVMGRFATISGMMGFTDIKEDDDRLTIQIRGGGPIGSLISVVRKDGNITKIKAYMDNPFVEVPLKENGKIDVGSAVGSAGFLNIIKKNEMVEEGYNGLVPLVSGEIAEDFANYFVKSDQKPTVLALGVLVNKLGVKASGGYLINLMPDATEEDINKIEEALQKAPSISQMLADNKSLKEIAEIVTGDKVKLLDDNLKIKFECDCSKENFERGLISLGKDELKEIIEKDGKADIICHFCNKEYHFTKEELEKLL